MSITTITASNYSPHLTAVPENRKPESRLPWAPHLRPLMLAPMQGLTNRALRQWFIEQVRPDTLFTEFLQVRPGARAGLSEVDCAEIAAQDVATPLVVQLIGRDNAALVQAATAAQTAGAQHININMGCPYGRMTQNAAGGALLKHPDALPETLAALRAAVRGTFSVKLRAGYEEPRQVFDLVETFEEAGVDFLILHPRTVVQRYHGMADHHLTAELCRRTRLPVIANGDINTADQARALLDEAGCAGLMLGRGAIADPWLFERIRGHRPTRADAATRRGELVDYLGALSHAYQGLFSGETQALYKLKEVVRYIPDATFAKVRKQLRRAQRLTAFHAILEDWRTRAAEDV